MNIEKDSVKVLDFTTNGGKETAGTEEGGGEGGISSSLLPEGLPDNIMREQHKILSQLTGSDAIKFYWDTVDPRLLLIEVQRLIKRKKQKPTGGQVNNLLSLSLSFPYWPLFIFTCSYSSTGLGESCVDIICHTGSVLFVSRH